MRRTLSSLCLAALLISQGNSPAGRLLPRADATQQQPSSGGTQKELSRAERRERILKSFEPTRALLKRKGVPFDPEELLKPGWEKTLAPRFAEMHEMQVTRKLGARLRGVQLGDILYLPEKVELTGDTVILARQIIFEGRHPVIKGNYSVSYRPAEMDGVLGVTLEVAMREQGREARFVKVGAKNSSSLKAFVPRLLKQNWSITIDTSGRGYKEWLEEQKKKNPQAGFHKTSLTGQDQHIDNSGGVGTLGPTGETGTTGNHGTPDPSPKGDDGVCGVDANGSPGFPGTAGGNGGEGKQGGQGGEGGDAKPIDVQIRNTTWANYTFLAHGGQGGQGGQGGTGGTGGNGAQGGAGGTGADCPCDLGRAGSGGDGGPGGKGGRGGKSGKGGTGGMGGEGADVIVTRPRNFEGVISHSEAPGKGGPGGKAGNPGPPGISGPGGERGRAASTSNCSSPRPRDGRPGEMLMNLGFGDWGDWGDVGPASPVRGKYIPKYADEGGETAGCTTPGWDGSCPPNTYPDGSGQCCSGSCGGVGALTPSFATAEGEPPAPNLAEGGGPGGCACDGVQRNNCFSSGGDWDDRSCSCASPLLIDVAGDGFRMTDGAGGVDFDFFGDGTRERMSWTQAGSDDAWLVLDRDGDGIVGDGRELFGTSTPQPSPPSGEEKNGFLALSVYDRVGNGGNGDGTIDNKDAIFTSLRLWQDKNHNGVSEAGELHTLESLGVTALGLDYKESKRTDEHGNRFLYRAKVEDAKKAKAGRWAWDVFPVKPR